MYLRKYGLRKKWLDKCLKRPVSEDPSKGNTENGTKHCWNLNGAPLPYLLITVKVIELEKVSFSDIQNLKTLC